VIGQHDGFARYTIGQRKGLPGGRSRPLHVIAIRPELREVVVGPAEALSRFDVTLEELNWLAEPLAVGDTCEVQVRHRSAAHRARVVAVGADRLSLELLEPARAVAPGQSGVLYRGEQVLGGGVIADS